MIVKTTKEINNIIYDYTYSDANMMIERDGVKYVEAIDPLNSQRDYIETNELIENSEFWIETKQKAEAYDILMGEQ